MNAVSTTLAALLIITSVANVWFAVWLHTANRMKDHWAKVNCILRDRVYLVSQNVGEAREACNSEIAEHNDLKWQLGELLRNKT